MSTGDVLIRRAGEVDRPAVERITSAAYEPWIPLLGGLPLPMTEDYAPRIMRDEVWLAETGGAPAGLIVIEVHNDHLLIFSVAVSPSGQGRGIGRALLAFAEQHATSAGIPELRLYTNEKMTRNIALYETVGYRETGRRPNPERAGWTLVDMAKALP